MVKSQTRYCCDLNFGVKRKMKHEIALGAIQRFAAIKTQILHKMRAPHTTILIYMTLWKLGEEHLRVQGNKQG
jgi:hypothetical protein